MSTKPECKPEHHTWHPSPTGHGPVYCHHCAAVKPGTEAKAALAPVAHETKVAPVAKAAAPAPKALVTSYPFDEPEETPTSPPALSAEEDTKPPGLSRFLGSKAPTKPKK